MRIAHIVWHFPVVSETFILNQVTGLLDLGHDVDIFAFRPPKGPLTTTHPEIQQYDLFRRTYRMLKERHTHFVRDTRPLLERGPYDIIHCQFGVLGAEFVTLKELASLKSKLVVSFRGYDISKFVAARGATVYEPLFQRGDCFLPNCNYFKKRLIELGCDPRKVVVLRSGIDSTLFPFTMRDPTAKRIRFISIGRLVEKKGMEYGIKAVAKVIQTKKNVHYLIVGNGPLQARLETVIREMDIGQHVEIVPEKNREELVEILRRSHVLIAPSITDDTGNQEGIPNVLKEAMAMGLPVVSTYHSGIPELIENGTSGFLVPERDVDGLAQKLTTLIDHPEIWLPMGKAGRLRIEEQYQSIKLNAKLAEIYHDLVSKRRLSRV